MCAYTQIFPCVYAHLHGIHGHRFVHECLCAMPCLPSERCQLDNAPLCALMQQSVGDVLSPQDWFAFSPVDGCGRVSAV